MKRVILLAAFVILPVMFGSAVAGRRSSKMDDKKEALQELNDFIGEWNGHGWLTTNRRTTWREKARWGWKFTKDDCWLKLTIPKAKNFKGGELRYDLDDEKYILTLTDNKDKKRVFTGELKGKRLVLQRVDPKTKDTQVLQMNSASSGTRFVYLYKEKPANRTIFYERFQVGFSKEGVTFAQIDKGPKCIVTGGLGTITVSYNGVTYYVCCSGCRDAFNANPAKIIAEYKKKRKRGR